MNVKKILALMLCAMMLLSLAACGAKGNDKQADMSGDSSAMTGEPKTAEEAVAMHKELLERENAILSDNTELWEKVFMEADKGMAMIEDGKNYGDFLLDTVEAAKEQFTDKEYAWLKESATEISNIENRLTELEEKYPEIMQKSMDGAMSMPAGSGTSNPPDDGSMQKFPAFEGKDLDGNTVKSDELFSANAVTVVNFWFTTCNPCVGELGELDALNKELAEKGGALIGVNTFTLDGDEKAIAEAKEVLAKKGATYQNIYFGSGGDAGKFVENVFAYPTTYVVDRSGNIVGEPIVGAITEKKQAETLQKLIDQALAADMG
ncbi:MAG: TlpA disulfide reductase family protein [Faecalibacterium prausnitzii]